MFTKDDINISTAEIDKNEKTKIITYSLVVVVLIGLVIFLNSINDKYNYIILDNETVVEYRNGEFIQVKKEDMNLDNKVYRIYNSGKFYGKHYLMNVTGSSFEFAKVKDNTYTFYSGFIGLSENFKHIPYEKLEFADVDLRRVQSHFNSSLFSDVTDLTYSYKIHMDFDNDGKLETLYFIDSSNNEGNDFSVVIYEKNGSFNIINQNKNSDEEDLYTVTNFSVHAIIDVNNDNRYELIFTNYLYDIPTYSIYKLEENNTYVKVMETSLVR